MFARCASTTTVYFNGGRLLEYQLVFAKATNTSENHVKYDDRYLTWIDRLFTSAIQTVSHLRRL
jgi:hypothetical protein